jgi:RXT2-like, N-terminal
LRVQATQTNNLFQKIEHAGYTRYILERNPRRYNEYGEELDDSESDPEADEDAAEENTYARIRLEGAYAQVTLRAALLT